MFNQYPYINENDLNLDYILKAVKTLKEIMDNFITLNTVTFADPIIWDITKQYARNTIVLDPSGNAYLSKEAVPVGVQLNNGDYWLEIFNFTDYTRTANQNLTVNVETNTTRATAAYNVDDWLIWNDVLYKVTAAIAIDDALVIGTNLVHFTVEDFIKAFMTWATNTIQQYKNDIDASESLYRQQLAGDIANTTASLQAQLNAAIAGATVDSEVINARIGADGVTYATLGEAIRTQITNLENYIDGAYDEISRIISVQPELVDGGYIRYPNGNVSPSDSAMNTGLLPLRDYTKLHVETVLGTAGYSVAFYDSAKVIISEISQQGQSTSRIYVYDYDLTDSTYDNAKYFAVSCYGPQYYSSVKIELSSEFDIAETKNKADSAIQMEDFENSIITDFPNNGYIEYNDGAPDSSSYGSYTDKIPLDGYSRIYYRGTGSNRLAVVAFYDRNNNYLQNISVAGIDVNSITSGIIDLTLPAYANAKYVVFTRYIYVYPASDSKFNLVGRLYDRFASNNLSGLVINAFGDSLTSTDYQRPTWWERIATRTGAAFNNYGVSGTTIADTSANSFVDRVTTLDTSADGVIVMGGTNDGATRRGAWNSTDVTTFYGALNYIIETLLTNFNGKQILFCTPIQPKNAYSNNSYNPFDTLNALSDTSTMTPQQRAAAIILKCRQYGLPCLDLYNCSGINGVTNDYYMDSLHPSQIGQERMSSLIQSKLETLYI